MASLHLLLEAPPSSCYHALLPNPRSTRHEKAGSNAFFRLRGENNRRVFMAVALNHRKGAPFLAARGAGAIVKHDGEEDDGALPESVRTIKKVLPAQKDVHQQIMARKPSSSRTSSDPEAEEQQAKLSSHGDNVSFLNIRKEPAGKHRPNHGEPESKYSSGTVSETHTPSKSEASRSFPSGIIRGSTQQNGSEPLKTKRIVSPIEDTHWSRETRQLRPTSKFLSGSSESYGGARDMNLKDSVEVLIGGVVGEHDSEHKKGKMEGVPPLAGTNVMNIILVAAECAPWCKTGGLGDVVGALPKALARRGHRVMVVVPRYDAYSEAKEIGIYRRYKIDGQDMEVSYFHAYIDGVDFVFMDSPIFRHRQDNIYGGNRQDILKRMVLLCKAAVEVPWYVPCGGACYGDGNLVFVANDWHTALLPVYLKAYYRDHGLMKYARSVLVIHNIAHQGRGPMEEFRYMDMPDHYMHLFKHHDPFGGEHLNVFAAGLRTADRLVTVSHGYAWELRTPEGGRGLHGIIGENEWKLQGIVNGIDIDDWNPALDVHLRSDGYVNYSIETLKSGKARCKASLQRQLGLEVHADVPMLAFIGRLDDQKGVDLIVDAAPWIVGQGAQLVMLGSGRRDLEYALRGLEGRHRDKVRCWVGFSVEMAHRITSGADALVMPSRFEPCGLNQLYAMAYGTVPVVHEVGGLRDTVRQFDPFADTGFGWNFQGAETGRMIDALGHCLNTYRHYRGSWEGIQRRGMMQDLSWDVAAKRYEDVLLAAKYQW